MTMPPRAARKKRPVSSAPAPKGPTAQAPQVDRSYRASLANLRNELQMPVNAVIEYSAMLLEDARAQGQEYFISDLLKIHALGKKLLLLVDDSLDETRIDPDWTGKELEDFNATLRHELRTPLNAIIGYSEMLLEDALEQGPKGFIADLEKIRAAGGLFLSFVEDIANFTMTGPQETGLGAELADSSAMVRKVMSEIPLLGEENPPLDPVNRGYLLVVDDNEINRDLICRQLARQGHVVTAAANGQQALELMQSQAFDMVLLDIMMPEMSGYQVLQRLKGSDLHRDVPVIVISALDEMDSVVGCIRMGADDYLLKPFNPVLLRARIRICLENKRLRELSAALELRNLKEEIQLIAESRAMQQVLDTVRTVSRTPVNVLIHGESGTGKEVIARLIHHGGSRKEKPFVAVNCASVPENLMESEFFGYEKGAFTGATVSRGGRFEDAEGGTLFLDEIGDMPLAMQPKFLRVIQENEGSRLGSNKLLGYDLRIISASNKNLRQEVEKGRFREDLYYRIYSVEIFIPPLRERREDILPLTLFFMNKVCHRFNKKVKGLSPEVLTFLEECPWPGNVRQLLHEVEHMVALTPDGGLISVKHCSPELQKLRNASPLPPPPSRPSLSLPQRVAEAEIDGIATALRMTRGNKLQAAKLLGITRQGLDKKLKRYKICASQKSESW